MMMMMSNTPCEMLGTSNIPKNYSEEDASLSACFYVETAAVTKVFKVQATQFTFVRLKALCRVLINEAKTNSGLIRGNGACNWEQAYLSAFYL